MAWFVDAFDVVLQTSSVEVAVVHDDDWCSTYSQKTGRIIDEYAQAFFNEQLLDQNEVNTWKARWKLIETSSVCQRFRLNNSSFSLALSDKKSINASEELAKNELLRGQGINGSGRSPPEWYLLTFCHFQQPSISPYWPLRMWQSFSHHLCPSCIQKNCNLILQQSQKQGFPQTSWQMPGESRF